jgi:predicted DNA-binding transcriptional regulator AlpA
MNYVKEKKMLLNKKEIAKELHLSVSMIDKLMTQGLPYIKIGKAVRFDPVEVKEWVKNR